MLCDKNTDQKERLNSSQLLQLVVVIYNSDRVRDLFQLARLLLWQTLVGYRRLWLAIGCYESYERAKTCMTKQSFAADVVNGAVTVVDGDDVAIDRILCQLLCSDIVGTHNNLAP